MLNTAYYQQHLQEGLLNLYGCFDEDISGLLSFLQHHPATQQLNLAYNRINQRIGIPLLNALAAATTLKSIDLYGNLLDDACMAALADTLLANKAIEKLSLIDNEIGAQGCRALTKALHQNPQLITLNLYHNKIGDQGCQALFEGLVTNTTLQDINIGSNGITNAGGEAARSYLRGIGGSGLSSLSNGDARPTKLHRIGLSNNEFTDALKVSLVAEAGIQGVVVEV